ncbi:MAG TPA: hypothetical protein VMT86_12145 [Bryobacteraceae bacterium]|nr:hypothetical protein [Bryobacteraceae bacterium]
MNCPFLKEARVRYCEKAAFRKMIRIAGDVAQETCSSPRYRGCGVYRLYADDSEDTRCPYLRESLTQYCAAASVSRFIPYSDPLLSRCGSDSYRYCDVYLGAANSSAPVAAERSERAVGGMLVPNWLHYSANHMWLDATMGGACHLGVDAFCTRALGTVERITFLKDGGIDRPHAVLTLRGMDLEVVFPNPVLLTASNRYLRANPGKLTADPYGAGWLFQGVQLPGQAPATSSLIRGDAIVPWIESEIAHMSAFLAGCRMAQQEAVSMADGGVFSPGVIQQLSREDALRLFHEFFWGFRV